MNQLKTSPEEEVFNEMLNMMANIEQEMEEVYVQNKLINGEISIGN